ncbi:helix-turn-helix transcriptional regulator [Pectobacterium versatile]|uniref:helix-turn-helix transcriptional regulator n=1 Tax=Pectobacterium versatile TaxID=2488639 RepID=UPI001CF476D3|nr:LuxR C-terminal-related transcriptional regulator [Pectobacterium versatile]MCA6935386.1 LuxR C-terminal-related transcriptional regulator [Pectobacterium versatile]
MRIEIFSKCAFTKVAFSYLEGMNYGNESISVIDIEHGIDTILLDRVINDEKIKFVIILNNRNHSPLLISNKVILISKHSPIKMFKKLIFTISIFNEITGHEVFLSSKEKMLFDCWLQGVSIKVIADNMTVTHKTANNMRNAIYRKYGIKDSFTFLLIAEISRMHNTAYTEHRKILCS